MNKKEIVKSIKIFGGILLISFSVVLLFISIFNDSGSDTAADKVERLSLNGKTCEEIAYEDWNITDMNCNLRLDVDMCECYRIIEKIKCLEYCFDKQ